VELEKKERVVRNKGNSLRVTTWNSAGATSSRIKKALWVKANLKSDVIMFQESGSIGSLRGYNLFEGKPVPYTILVKGKQEPKEKVWVGTLVNKNLPSKIVFKD